MKRMMAGLFLFAASVAFGGTTYKWSGGAGTDADGYYRWNVSGNWEGGNVPQSGDENILVFSLGSGTLKYKNDIEGLRIRGFQVNTPAGSTHTFEGNKLTLVGGSTATYGDPWSKRTGDGVFICMIPFQIVGRYYYNTSGGRSYLYNDFFADASDAAEFRISGSGTTNLKGDWSGYTGYRWVESRLDIESGLSLPAGETLTMYNKTTQSVRFNAKDATFAGDVAVESKTVGTITGIVVDNDGTWTGDFTVPNGYSDTQNMNWSVAANKSFTFAGGFKSGRGINLYLNVGSGATATFSGDHTFEARTFRLNGAGTTAIDRSFGLSGQYIYCYGGGTVKMLSNGRLEGNTFVFGAGASQQTGTLDLNGVNQSVTRLMDDSASAAGYVGFHIKSAMRATLAVNTTDSKIVAVVEDEAGVCADGITLTAQPQATAISSGWFEAKNGGVVDFSGCSAIGAAARLSIASGCTVVVPSGVTLEFAQVYLDGEPLPADDYDDFVTGGGKVRAKTSGPTTKDRTFTWKGGADGDSTASEANWNEGAAELSNGRSELDFRSGTAQAVLAGKSAAHDLVLGRTGGFTLSAADGAFLNLFNGGLSVAEGSGVQEISAPLATAWAPQTWTVGADATLKLSGPFCTPAVGEITASGSGTLRLEGANDGFTAPLVATGGLKVVVSSDTGLGTDEGSFSMFAGDANANGSNTSWLFFEGDRVVSPSVSFLGATGKLTDEGASLAFKSKFTFLDGEGKNQTSALRVSRNSTLDFEGGLDCGGIYRFFLNVEPGSTTTVSKVAIDGKRTQPSNAEIDLCATESTLPVGVLRLDVAGSTWRIFRLLQGELMCGAENALARDGWVLVGRSDSFFAANSNGMVLNLNGFDQLTCGISTVFSFTSATCDPAAYCAIVKSAEPAALIMDPTGTYDSQNELVGDIRFTGKAGLRFVPSKPAYSAFTLAYQLSDTEGALEVSSGTLTFDRGAGWGGSSNVVVNGTGTLNIREASVDTAFGVRGARTTLTLEGSGKLTIPAGKTVVVRHAKIDGEYVNAGTYGAVGSGAADTSHAAHFTENGGILRVRSLPNPGFAIIFR